MNVIAGESQVLVTINGSTISVGPIVIEEELKTAMFLFKEDLPKWEYEIQVIVDFLLGEDPGIKRLKNALKYSPVWKVMDMDSEVLMNIEHGQDELDAYVMALSDVCMNA